jgi:membrane-associated protease RseP (regulator of RpoE activity)
MSFLFYDLTFLIAFSLFVIIFLYVERKKIVREGPMFLYKTKIGLRFIDYMGKNFPRTIKFLSYVSIGIGYILMFFSVYLVWLAIQAFMRPEFVKVIKIPPIMPLIPYLPELFKIDWLPPFYFTYWIVALALILVFHEGAHGIFARFYNIRIKSTGFGFLGPFLAFFVEQDDRQMKKAKPFAQLSILSAGVFANLILALIVLLMMAGMSSLAYEQSGVQVKGYIYSIVDISALNSASITNETIQVDGYNLTKIILNENSYLVTQESLNYRENATGEINVAIFQDMPAIRNSMMKKAISSMDGEPIRNVADLEKITSSHKPGDKVQIGLRETSIQNKTQVVYEIELGADPNNDTRAIIGIARQNPNSLSGLKSLSYKVISWFRDPNVYYEPRGNYEFTGFIYTLLWWLLFINVSVAIVNMMPIAIFDGGQFFYLTVLMITRKKKIAERAFKITTQVLIAAFILLMILWAVGFFL